MDAGCFRLPTCRQGSIGFLSAVNRSNVALSRAKQGMYIIGNATCIAESQQAQKAGFWPSVISQLEAEDRIGPALPLVCQNHPETGALSPLINSTKEAGMEPCWPRQL